MNILEKFIKNKSKKIIGRGHSGKAGKTAGKGHKGQKSRSGFNIPNGFEGGQSTITTRSPKSRVKMKKKTLYMILDYTKISSLLDNEKNISKKLLIEKKIIKDNEIKKNIKLSQVPNNIKDEKKFIDIKLTKK